MVELSKKWKLLLNGNGNGKEKIYVIIYISKDSPY